MFKFHTVSKIACVALTFFSAINSTYGQSPDVNQVGGSQSLSTSPSLCTTEYPRAALMAEEYGTVGIKYVVDDNGQMVESTVLYSSGYKRLDASALKMMPNCVGHGRPLVIDGLPVKNSFVFEVAFNVPGVRPPLFGASQSALGSYTYFAALGIKCKKERYDIENALASARKEIFEKHKQSIKSLPDTPLKQAAMKRFDEMERFAPDDAAINSFNTYFSIRNSEQIQALCASAAGLIQSTKE